MDPMDPTPHYLETELTDLVQRDPAIFRFLQDGSLDGLWYWDLKEPDNEWMSDQLWRVLGHDPDAMEHSPRAWQDLIHPQDLQTALANLDAHIADPDHPCDQVVRYTAADGTLRWVRCRGIVIRDDQGVPHRMLGAHNDLTQLMRTKAELAARVQELEAAQAELQVSNQALRRFVSIVSHDLREPARTLRSFSDLLERRCGDQLDARGAVYLEHLQGGSVRLTEMLGALTTLSRLATQPARADQVDLDQLLREIVDDLAVAIAGSGAVVEIAPLGHVQGDAALLRVLFQNLVANGIKFARPDTPPTVRVFRERDAICVQDDGIGIPDTAGRRIFAPFARLHARGTYEGTGMGLSLCNQVVELHRGHLDYRSTDGHGVTFVVTLGGQGLAPTSP